MHFRLSFKFKLSFEPTEDVLLLSSGHLCSLLSLFVFVSLNVKLMGFFSVENIRQIHQGGKNFQYTEKVLDEVTFL